MVALLGLLLIYLIFGAQSGGVSRPAAKLLLASVVVVALAAAWATKPDDLARGSFFERRLLTKRAAFVILAMLAAFSIAKDLGPDLDRLVGSGSSSASDKLSPSENATSADRQSVDAQLLGRLQGEWGEPGCAVSFRFTVRGRALVIESGARPAGEPAFRSVATITGMDGNIVETRSDDYRASTFSYSTNGVSEVLTWDDARETPPSRYVRCGARR